MGLHRFLLVVALVMAGPAFAKKKIVVDAPRPFNTLIFNALLKKGYKPVGAKQSLSRDPLTREIQRVSRSAGAVAIARGRIAGRTWQLQIFTAHDGALVATAMFKVKGKKRLKKLPRNAMFELIQGVAQGHPVGWKERAPKVVAKADAPKADEEVDTDSASSTDDSDASTGGNDIRLSFDDDEGGSELPAMRASLGFRGFNRSFGYAGNPSAALATYNLGFAPAVALDAQWYPGSHFTGGIAANAGVFVQGDLGVGVASRQDQSRYGTRADRFRFGALMRFPVGPLEPQVHVGYSTQTFAISPNAATPDAAPRPNIPSVTFNGPRAGGSVRLSLFDRFSVDAGGGVTYVYGKGELASERYFPNATAFAADASAGVSFKLVKNIEVRASADWTRYFVKLNPTQGMTLTAESATDQYVGGTLSLSWVM